LCERLSGLHGGSGNCFAHTIKSCHGACVEEEQPETYNERVRELIDRYSYENKDMLLVGRGREVDEKSALLIEDGEFKGVGYFNLNHQINNLDIIRSIITPMNNNRDAEHIIQSFLRKKHQFKIIQLSIHE
jgi:DNA polymerase-3 subunit epsilon